MTRHLLFLSALAVSSDALACGGFFCSNEPIDQTKERIVFAIDETEQKVEVHVQVFYEGDAADFAWVVPVPTQPEPGLSTDRLFSVLDANTRPVYTLLREERGECDIVWQDTGWDETADWATGSTVSVADSGGEPAPPEGIQIIAVDDIGAFEITTVQADSQQVLTTWLGDPDGDPLTDDAYDLPEGIGTVLAPYVAESAYFLAIKLQKEASAGDITPLKFSYDGGAASIPIVLTSIAAQPDMRLETYVLGSRRAVPDNYLQVQVNEAAYDWLGEDNHEDVITMAANEAGGHAFGTDFAGPAEPLRNQIWRNGWMNLGTLRTKTDPSDFLAELRWGSWPRDAQMLSILQRVMPIPQDVIDDGVDPTDFYNCISCYTDTSELDFDPDAAADVLDEEVRQPIVTAEEMVRKHAYLTRLTSSMSSEEMTIDPIFVLNDTLGDVSREHQATLVYDCTEQADPTKSPRHILLADGTVYAVPPEDKMFTDFTGTKDFLSNLGMEGALKMADASATGIPMELRDNTFDRNARLNAHNAAMMALYGGDLPMNPVEAPDVEPDEPGEAPDGSLSGDGERIVPSACGCNTGTAGGSWLLLPLLALASRRRGDGA